MDLTLHVHMLLIATLHIVTPLGHETCKCMYDECHSKPMANDVVIITTIVDS